MWRIQRDFFYDPNAHGLDLAAAEKLYAPFLEGIAGREDLTYLIEEGLGTSSLVTLVRAVARHPSRST